MKLDTDGYFTIQNVGLTVHTCIVEILKLRKLYNAQSLVSVLERGIRGSLPVPEVGAGVIFGLLVCHARSLKGVTLMDEVMVHPLPVLGSGWVPKHGLIVCLLSSVHCLSVMVYGWRRPVVKESWDCIIFRPA